MAARKAAKNSQPEASETTGARTRDEFIEAKVVAFAEQLGRLVGTVQAKAEGWLDQKTLSKEISRIRESAAGLLAHVNGMGSSPPKAVVTQGAAPAPPRSRGPVDAPGKRHRKPVPKERIDKRIGEPEGKQMGQKNAKTAGRRGVRR
jgi:hypothetical protein